MVFSHYFFSVNYNLIHGPIRRANQLYSYLKQQERMGKEEESIQKLSFVAKNKATALIMGKQISSQRKIVLCLY